MKIKGFSGIVLLILFVLALSACGGDEPTEPTATAASSESATIIPTATAEPAPTALTEPLFGLATVESVEVQIADAFPVEVSLRVRGVLANDCTQIDTIIAQQNGTTFDVAITTLQEPGQVCNQAVVPFEETVPLDVVGLEAGSYTVDVNGIQGSFTLDADNVIAEATAEPTVTAEESNLVINGRVWHDLCAVPEGEVTALPEGCVTTGDGNFRGDGELDDEPGIEGVRVTIGAGTCPAAGLGVTTTDADGNYSFDGLAAGTYCIVVDTFDPQNDAILSPGAWTAPAGDDAKISVVLSAAAASEPVNFGWDYQFLPIDEATIDLSNCENSFEFVQDLNIPDDTEFQPGADFTKEWRLRNNGTCPWTADYSVAFVGGDQMSAAENTPLPKTVAAGETVTVAVDMVAPQEEGSYRGNFQIADPNDEPFGLNGVIEDAFFLRIIVAEDAAPVATPLPNSAAIGGVVWDDFCINSAPGRGCINSDGGSIGNGTFDAFETALPGITISLAQNACPTGGSLPAASAVLATAVTDEDGRYLFESLTDATYCIFMDALSPENLDLLIPGNWTWPATGVGLYSFILDPGEQALDLDFGWDFVD